MLYLTNSIMQTWRDCHRKFYWSEICRYAPKSSEAMFDGTIAHKAIKEHCLGEGVNYSDIKEAYKNEVLKAEISRIANINERQAKITSMMRAYEELYKGDSERFTFLAIEEEISIPLTTNIIVAGTPDEIAIEKSSGDLTLFENKTASKITSSYLERLNLDTQLTQYCWLIKKKYGKAPMKIIYNILAKTACRLKKNETWDEFEQRITELYLSEDENTRLYREELIRDDASLENFEEGVLQIAKEIMDLQEAKAPMSAYYINSQPCTYYDGCLYLPLCTLGEQNAKIMYKQSERKGCFQ